MKYRFLTSVLVLSGLAGCGPSYSPDTYASNAAQQANKVEQGIIVGVRDVAVSAAGTVGTVTGAAAGGIAGAQAVSGPISAFTSLGGALVGGIGGSAVEHVTADTTAFEYIVRKPNGDLISVTQKDKTPLVLGQKVLVIAGTQARIVPDYTVPPLVKTADAPKPNQAKPADAKVDDPKPGEPPKAVQPGPDASVEEAKPASADAPAVKSETTPPVTASPAQTSVVAVPPVAASPANPQP